MQNIELNKVGSGWRFMRAHPENIRNTSESSSEKIQSIIESTKDLKGKDEKSIRENIKILKRTKNEVKDKINEGNPCDADDLKKKLSNIYLNRGKAYFLIGEFKKSKEDCVKASLLGVQYAGSEEILL